jgi:DNA-binding transcriptional MerR regulator
LKGIYLMLQCFTTRDVLHLTGVSARQLQWWDEQGVVVPKREGRKRIYSAEDLIDILVIEELRRRQISLQQVRRVLRFLRKELRLRLADLAQGKREHHLLLSGRHIYLESDSHQIIDLMRNTSQPMLLICLTDAVKHLRMDLRQVLAQAPKKTAGPARSKRRAPEKAQTA